MYIRLYGSRDVIIARAQPPLRRVLDFILELPILEFQSYRPYRLGKRRKICNFPLLHARAVIIVCAIVLFYTV